MHSIAGTPQIKLLTTLFMFSIISIIRSVLFLFSDVTVQYLRIYLSLCLEYFRLTLGMINDYFFFLTDLFQLS